MADISAIFGILLALAIIFPGWLMALWLVFPATVERARVRLEKTPWQCFWLGGVLTAILSIPIVVLLALPFGPAKFTGFALLVIALAIAGIGAAGLAAKMADALLKQTTTLSRANAFVRGAIALELAAALPLIGWFIVLPLASVLALGATAFALLHWMPVTSASVKVSSTQVPSSPIAE